MYLIFWIIFTFFAVVGVANIIMSLVYYLTKIKDDSSMLLVIPKIDDQIDAELVLRSAAAKVRRLGKNHPQQVICINDGLDDETKKICEYVCKDYSYIKMMSSDELSKLIKR